MNIKLSDYLALIAVGLMLWGVIIATVFVASKFLSPVFAMVF